VSEARFRAGCGRERMAPSELREVAYVDLAFDECGSCRHRVDPEDARSFCRWLRHDVPGPFAPLADVNLDEGAS